MSDERGPRAKNWCFTLNNYTPQDVDRLSSPIEGVSYLIYGKEIGESGTPHLQGTVVFQSRKRLSQVIAKIGQAHCTVTRMLTQSIDYCKKEGDFTELGDLPQKNVGKRNDLEDFKEAVKKGELSMKALRENYSDVCALYPRFVERYVEDNMPTALVETHPLRPWQEELYKTLKKAPDSRQIIFIVDISGNQGKSWFARYYCQCNDNAQIVVPGKKADMAYVVSALSRVVFFDCPRSKQGDFIQYDFLEEVKNGYFFSPKYESKIKTMPQPHIVVLMNEHPDETKLSQDRYHVTILKD